MKRTQRNSARAGVRMYFLAGAAVLVALAVYLGFEWRPDKVVAEKQAALISAIERRDRADIRHLLADDYEDRWDFSADDAAETLVDVGSQMLTLVIWTNGQELQRDGSEIVVVADLTAEGNAISPVGHEAIRRINRLDEAFEFRWKKVGFFPTHWRVVEIENPDLPDDLYGYEPGDFRRAMEGARERLGE